MTMIKVKHKVGIVEEQIQVEIDEVMCYIKLLAY